MDKHSPQQRSFNMSQVKSKNTKPEMYVFSVLEKLNIKFERHFATFGKPDVVFLDKKVAVFINGEFWHGRKFHKEKIAYKEFWIKKISDNMIRDRKNYRLLKKEGWTVVKIWDKDIKKYPNREINKIMKALGHPLIYKSNL